MVSHELIHSSLKPHICNVCHLKFRRIHDLKRHEKLHTGEKPYSCDRCSRRFARPDALTRHQNSTNACTVNANSNNNNNFCNNNSMGNIHNGYTNGESSSPNFNQNPVNNQTRPLSHLHSGNSVDSGDEVPQRPALAVNQHDERDSSAASNSTGASSNFSSTGNEPATSGDSTTTHDTNCIPTLKTIGLDQENSDNKQNTRSRSNQEFSTNRHQHMTEQQRRTQSLDNKTYPTIQKHILQKASSGSSSAFTPNPIHPLSFYPFPNFNNLNSSNNSNPNNNNNHHMNQISLPPLSVPHQPLPQASFIPQMTPHFPQQNFDGLLPIITKGTGASSITTISGTPYGDEVHPIQRSDLTSVSTLALAKSSPGLPGLTHIAATPMKFPPNPTSILRNNRCRQILDIKLISREATQIRKHYSWCNWRYWWDAYFKPNANW